MELYEFTVRNTLGVADTSYYTSNTEDTVVGIHTYLAIPIARGEISFDFDKNVLTVTMPMNTWPASEFKLVNPYGVVEIIVKDAIETIMFNGRVKACNFNVEKGTAKLSATSIQEVLDSQVPVKVYSPSCPYELYGSGCGIDVEAYRLVVDFIDSTISTLTVVNGAFALQPDGYYNGGWVETLTERITISEHIGATLTLLFTLRVDVADTLSFSVFPGCDKMLTTCTDKFNNAVQFGGFPWVPLNNPVSEEF